LTPRGTLAPNEATTDASTTTTLGGSELAKPIVLDYEELQSNKVLDLFPRLLEAFGDNPECLGIILINMTSVPEYPACGKHFFLILLIAVLPQEELQKLENPHAKYVVGWSHGKERLKSGAVDSRKGM